ncbi:MAG TPA: type I polyketide synthase, partial [Solirubrobacterales bacterium]|nr:type I polyketide synthase [Solirubrobacterales bacterium]
MAGAGGNGSLIAVVGIGCRLPGAPDPEGFWRLLSEGRDAVGEIPARRLELAGYADEERALWESESGARFGAFLADVEGFDLAFFGISPREAAAMDPQQRLALELAWEALDDAGAGAERDGAGVFLGSISSDYSTLLDRYGAEAIDRHSVTGLQRGIIANRVSYALGLSGPSFTVDAAQSSSLVAVHLACESLRRGESEIALAGGIHLNIDPRGALKASRFGGLSPDGRCFVFDDRANGYVRGEGGGIVVLKTLARAQRDGDRVYCAIRATAVNNDGGGAGLTVPNREAQEGVIARAWRRAGLKRSAAQYVELHGTGTAVGDPVEAAALGAVLGAGREGRAALAVGSAKTNIGHLEGAAGIAGLIKAALAIERRRLPASLNFERPNPEIPLDRLGLRVQRELGAWPDESAPLLAGVSSFGMGGTNCHVVLAEAPELSAAPATDAPDPAGPVLLPLSARSPVALGDVAMRLAAEIEADPELNPLDLSFSLATARTALEQRLAIVGNSRDDLLERLRAAGRGELPDGVVRGRGASERRPVFLFGGQGSQWPGMASGLLDSSAPFADSIAACERALAPHLDWSLSEVLRDPDGDRLDRVDVVQPVLFAVMVSLARLWEAHGVRPAVAVGNSQGEIAAAHVCGAISLADAARLVALRSRALTALVGKGGMLAVSSSPERLAPLLERGGDEVSLAAVNGPETVTLSGASDALAWIRGELDREGTRVRDVAANDCAGHSVQIEQLREELLSAFAPVSPGAARIPFYSTVTGTALDTAELGPEHWYRNLRQTVLFEPALRSLLAAGHRAFLEISPHPMLAYGAEETIEDWAGAEQEEEAFVLATLRRGEGGPEHFARALARAHVRGLEIDWQAHFAGTAPRRVPLPTYPFQRRRCWFDLDREQVEPRPAGQGASSPEGAVPADPAAPAQADIEEVVGNEVAAVLGYAGASEVPRERSFKELGFDSIAVVELRNRLREATGRPLTSAAIYNHPTTALLAGYLREPAGDAVEVAGAAVGLAAGEPIAIVGMACRYPGGADRPEQLWQLLEEGRDCIGGFPSDRGWDLGRLYHPDPAHPGTSYAREGGFLADPGAFDAEFFGISPREATAMDPQQRLALELSWEALEDAGIDPLSLRGGRAGVFLGISSQDYTAGLRGGEEGTEGYRLIGSATSVASGRIAYALALEGPAITIDTACSSSLVALHLAAGALRGGECSLALAGGATVLSSPGLFTEFSRQRGLAPDGRSKSFSASADGVGWGEGAGLLVLERLSDAKANGHPVHALIRGSAVNQDGASNGLTAPNGFAQERVIRQALAGAGLEPSEVDAVEAHGTGTTLGDPIEAEALLATYGREREAPLRLGSVKSNIGHTQAAAGVAGVIKMALAMRAGVLPRTLHLDAPTPEVEWGDGAVQLLSEAEPWQRGEQPRRAGVSSFGISGTNAHLILEEAPQSSAWEEEQGKEGSGASSREAADPAPLPFVLSARSQPALSDAAGRLVAHLRTVPELALGDVSYSLATTRAALPERALVQASSREQLLAELEALAQGVAGKATARGAAAGGRLAYLFSGQGSQRLGMGRELHASYPVYAQAFDRICALFDAELERPLAAVVFGSGVRAARLLDNTAYAQPALFATELALFRLLESLGLEPDLLLGHSVGEIVAAHLAGVFSLADAVKLVAARGAAMAALPAGGAMLALEASETEALAAIEGKEQLLSLAAINSPSATVISGDAKAIEEIESQFQGEGRKTKRLAVSHAFHSPLIEPMLEEFSAIVSSLALGEPRLPVVSNLSGEVLTPEQATDPAYWVAHVRRPVRFADGVRSLRERGAGAFLELGPDPVLSSMAAACLDDEERGLGFAPSLRRGRPEAESLLAAIAVAQVNGAAIDWRRFFADAAPRRVALPTYPFQRKRYWLSEGDGSQGARAAGQTGLDHPLLGAAIEAAGDGSLTLTGRVSLSSHPWLADHAVLGSVLFPGTGFLELALRAGEEVGLRGVEELTLQAPLVLSEQAGVQLQVSVGAADGDGRRELAIYSRAEDGGDEGLTADRGWIGHAGGVLYEPPQPIQPGGTWPPRGAEPVDVEFQYDRLAEVGFDYGPAFQGLTAAWRDGEDLYAEVTLPEIQRSRPGQFVSDPVLLDSVLHAIGLSAAGDPAGEGQVQLPFAWSEVVAAAGEVGSRLIARIAADGAGGISLSLADPSGAPVLEVGSLARRPLNQEQLSEQRPRSETLFELGWHELELGEGAVEPVVLGAAEGPAALCEREGAPPELVVCDLGQAASAAEAGSRSRQLAERTLDLTQQWLAEERLAESRLVFLTHGATSVDGAEVSDPAAAAVWGLVRSAQTEHPGRFVLIDSDSTPASASVLPAALMAVAEPQLTLREGRALMPRLARAPVAEAPPVGFDPGKTVLITGGTGGLGALFARHLVAEHGARHLLLVSRAGENAPGGTDLAAQLEELGATVSLAACDVSDRAQLEHLLDSIDARRPLGAVVHAAGVVEDGTIEALDARALGSVFAPKAEAAWHLHELTAGMELSAFVLFSSVAATFGSAGQANYASANAFLDGLASYRRGRGLAATSLAWGLWSPERGMGSGLATADLARMRRSGVEAMLENQGLALFDSALCSERAVAVAARLDPIALRSQAVAGTLPPVLSGLVKVPSPRTGGSSLAARLGRIDEAAREEHVLSLVRGEVATVLGHGSAEEIDVGTAFKDLGFDSLAAVELRNRLKAATGLRLAATTVFDHPTPAALARHLLATVGAGRPERPLAVRASASDEPIAIVGMSCRYPGGVESPGQLWRLLAEGRDAISAFPDDRGWDLGRLYDPDPAVPRTSYAREGGFLPDPGQFDAEFFGVPPREAIAMDPQQRLLLETCWEALEHAGIDPDSLRGEPAGVFAGIMHHDYGGAGVPPVEVEGYLAVGVAGSVASGRVAYQLGLEGPALTVDTACSSSLVTLHLASQALRQGECSLALAGGATVISTPSLFVEFARQRGLSADGRCKSFSDGADGVGWAEGVGMLALERLSDAQRNGHEVLATIRGSAVNQDGASNGLTAPNGPSQERVIRQALANARLEPADIDAVEAHGTGTTLGDPIEAGALLATYGQEREAPLRLGSVKSNIGHTQAAAGVAGVIKTVMAMREGVLPKTLHVDSPSSKVDWEAGDIELLTEASEWK